MTGDQDNDDRAKRYALRKSIMDYGMGVIIACFGIFFLIAPRLGIVFGMENLFRYLLGALFILYGLFRMYRGYKKNYFN